jgi:hypothetical protein
MAGKNITVNQRRFIKEILAGKSQRQAYLIAYPRAKKWTNGSVDVAAHRLSQNTKIAHSLKHGHEKRIQKAVEEGIVEGLDVIRELARISFSQVTDFVKIEDGVVKISDTGELSEDKLAAVEAIKETPTGIEVKFWSKLRALRDLGEALKLFDQGMMIDNSEDDGFVEAITGSIKDIWTEEE